MHFWKYTGLLITWINTFKLNQNICNLHVQTVLMNNKTNTKPTVFGGQTTQQMDRPKLLNLTNTQKPKELSYMQSNYMMQKEDFINWM